MLQNSLWIALGGALGTLARFWVSELFMTWFGGRFPWGTVFINITGSFVIGIFASMVGAGGRYDVPVLWQSFVMIGLCGGYTTFSSFSLQTLNMMQRGEWTVAALHIAGSVILCLLAVWLGAMLGSTLNHLKSA